MELTQENVEKLNVAKMPDALLCKGLLLDAIEAGDALEKELSNLRQDYRKISELYISEQNKCGHLEARIKELEADAELDQKKRLMLCKGYNQKCERVKELESQCAKYQAELMNNDPALDLTPPTTEDSLGVEKEML